MTNALPAANIGVAENFASAFTIMSTSAVPTQSVMTHNDACNAIFRPERQSSPFSVVTAQQPYAVSGENHSTIHVEIIQSQVTFYATLPNKDPLCPFVTEF